MFEALRLASQGLPIFGSFKKNAIVEKKKLSLNDFTEAINLGFELLPKQKEMLEFACLSGVRQLLGQRDIGKTTIPVVVATIWKLYLDPTKTIQIVCGDYGKAKDILYFTGVLMKNSKLFPGLSVVRTQIRTKENASNKVKKEPSIFIGSLKTTLRGKHPDEVIFDDLLTMETSIYRSYRQRAKRIYEESLSLTKNILVVGQPTHPDDLYEFLRGKEEVKKMEVWNGDIPEKTISVDALRSQGMSDFTIYANYYGKLLVDDSLPFSSCLVMKSEDLSSIEAQLFAYYDFSFGKNDSNALSICFIYNFKVYILGYSSVCRWSDFIEKTIPILQKLGINKVAYEDNITGSEPDSYFVNKGIFPRSERTTENKQHKIARLYQFVNDIILIKTEDTMNEHFITQFKNYAPIDSSCLDDAVDSATMNLILMNYLNLRKTK